MDATPLPQRLTDDELVAALHVRGHILRVRATSRRTPLLGPSLTKAQRALAVAARSQLSDDVPDLYQGLLEAAVAAEDALTRLLVAHPDLKPRIT